MADRGTHEPFAYNITEKVLDKLRSLSRPEIFSHFNSLVQRELKELEFTLSSIRGVLLDADEQQGKDPQLRDWLRKLKDVCYDADDVLDELEYKALWQNGENERKVRNFFSFLSPIQFQMKEIRERLVVIEAEKANFNLTERAEDRHVMKRERTETDFSVQHNLDLIIGRDDDKEVIVRRLMDASDDDDENVSVISICAMGGVGKTAIAKLVYKDDRVARHFQLKMWIYVGYEFDVKKLTKEIINSATHSYCGDLTLDQMQTLLQDTLRDKMFLLVLDNVWNRDRVRWYELKQNLMVGANGSKIIVTTRTERVASCMDTTYLHQLQGLPEEVSLSLFMRCAFRKGEMHMYPNLVKIGAELVERCSGHPLYVRILGSLLSSTTDERYWTSIRDSEIWLSKRIETGVVLPALKLSYNAMPSYLKQCFSYCSIFEYGSEIIVADLIQRWIAQGFIRPFDENQELEDIGQTYFEELCSLSFFRIVEQNPLYRTFKMHDLIRDLAQSVTRSEFRTVSLDVQNISEKDQYVRTIRYLVDERVKLTREFSWVERCISRFKSLRVLDLSGSHFEVLPITIGNLKHLRYFNISNNRSIKKLPSSTCKLLNLQSLRLGGCWELEKLPRDIAKLINLRHLLLTTKQLFLPKEGIGRLKSLQFLGIVGCGNLKSLCVGMQGLTALRTLLISDCRNLESLPSNIKHLTALETLSIENCEKLILTEWEEDIQGLRLSLRMLFITRLPQLETLPQWLRGAKDTLQLISIRDCWDIKALPEWLQYFTSLQKLEISLCPRLWALPEGMCCLTALRELKIEDCPELNRRCEEGTGKDWPKIAHVPKIIRLERTSEIFRNRRKLLNKLMFLNQ